MAGTARRLVGRTRGERLEARITADQKALIQRAAELEGRNSGRDLARFEVRRDARGGAQR